MLCRCELVCFKLFQQAYFEGTQIPRAKTRAISYHISCVASSLISIHLLVNCSATTGLQNVLRHKWMAQKQCIPLNVLSSPKRAGSHCHQAASTISSEMKSDVPHSGLIENLPKAVFFFILARVTFHLVWLLTMKDHQLIR